MPTIQKRIRVIDVPNGLTAEETERLLNEPCEAGYYVTRTVALADDAGMRVFYTLRMRPER